MFLGGKDGKVLGEGKKGRGLGRERGKEYIALSAKGQGG